MRNYFKKVIKKYLLKPYPLNTKNWKITISISLFITFFIIIFQPFGLSSLETKYKFLINIGYGFVTFLTLVLNLFIITKIFKVFFVEDSWKVWKQIIWLIWIVFTIGMGNFLYSTLFFNFANNFTGLLIFQGFTILISIIPISILTIIRQNKILSQNLANAKEINRINTEVKKNKTNHKSKSIEIFSDNKNDSLKIFSEQIYYIEAEGNYVKIYFSENNNLKNKMLRSSLKKIEEQITEIAFLIKCHRAFIVNINKIETSKGNSQGLKLKIINLENEIPVSRNYVKILKTKIEN